MPSKRFAAACALALLLTGCAGQPSLILPQSLDVPDRKPVDQAAPAPQAAPAGKPREKVEWMPTAPLTAPDKKPQADAAVPQPSADPEKEKANINVNFEQVPLTTLIQVVYTEILGRPVNIDPKVMERRDLVTFRTPASQTPEQIRDAMLILLKSYGIAALDAGGLIRVVPDSAQAGFLPEIRRGSALPETPKILRPIFQMVDIQTVRNNEVAGWIKNMFSGRVVVHEDIGRNALLLSGNSDNVAAAIEAIRVLDQPVMRGRASMRLNPVFWSAEDLTKRMSEILAAEGYSMPPANYSPLAGGVRYPILFLPMAAYNAILVFAVSDEVLEHVADWVKKLDQPNDRVVSKGFFTYAAQNLTAEELAHSLTQLFMSSAPAAPAPGAPAGAPVPGGLGSGRVVVDKSGNMLIFHTTAGEYSQIINLLRILDRPARSALIEVTVAELTLTDDSQLGIEWLLKDIGVSGSGVTAGTLGALSVGTAGLTIKRLVSGGDTRLLINALASSNRATILSSPRIMARNGQTATIQVGQEVPIITSQQSTVSATNVLGTGVLQTVQYRSTGVILKVKPVIHSGNRVDLEIQQEVSAAQTTVTGVNNSPTIATRRVQTNLTLQSGSTALLGGLISGNNSTGNSGIPLLKDIPIVGALFRTDTDKNSKTELVVLITPHVMNDDSDVQSVTEAFKSLTPWLVSGDKSKNKDKDKDKP